MITFCKTHWKYIGVLLPLAVSTVLWVIHVETGLNKSDRLLRIEELVEPLIVEWKAEQLLLERGYIVPVPPHDHPEFNHDHAFTPSFPPASHSHGIPLEDAREDAQKWTNHAIKQAGY